MASRVPLEATPVLEWPGVQLTAVAVTLEDGHTIAFLGDSQGQLHRVSLQEVLVLVLVFGGNGIPGLGKMTCALPRAGKYLPVLCPTLGWL